MIPPGLLLILLGAVGAVVALSAVPAGGADVVDLHVESTATWHPVLSKWTVSAPSLSIKESKIIDFGSMLRNALALTSESKDFAFTLQKDGVVVETILQSTGKGGVFDNENTQHVVFRKITPGDYVVHARILSAGNVVAESSTPMRIIPEDA